LNRIHLESGCQTGTLIVSGGAELKSNELEAIKVDVG